MKKYIYSLFVILLSSCSFKIDKESRLKKNLSIELNDVPSHLNEAIQHLLFNPNLNSQIQAYVAPNSISDFNCFFANVTGPGVGSQPTYINECAFRLTQGRPIGATSLLFQRGQPATMEVPSGINLIVDVYGWYPSVYPYCTNTEASSGSAGYFLGSKSVKLLDSEGVSVPISFVSGVQPINLRRHLMFNRDILMILLPKIFILLGINSIL